MGALPVTSFKQQQRKRMLNLSSLSCNGLLILLSELSLPSLDVPWLTSSPRFIAARFTYVEARSTTPVGAEDSYIWTGM